MPFFLKVTQGGIIRWLRGKSPEDIGGLYTEDLQTCVAIVICGKQGITLIHDTGRLSANTIVREFELVGSIVYWDIGYNSKFSSASENAQQMLSKLRSRRIREPTHTHDCNLSFMSVDIRGHIDLQTKPLILKNPLAEDLRHRINILNDLFCIDEEFPADLQHDGLRQFPPPQLLKTLPQMLDTLEQCSAYMEDIDLYFGNVLFYFMYYQPQDYEREQKRLAKLVPQMTDTGIESFEINCKMLLKFKTPNHCIALRRAAQCGDFTDLQFFLLPDKDNRIDSQGAESGKTALHVAIESKKYKNVQFLLDQGASFDITDAKGKTVLDYVRDSGDEVLHHIFESYLSSPMTPQYKLLPI